MHFLSRFMDSDGYMADLLQRCAAAFAFSLMIAGVLAGWFIEKLLQFKLEQVFLKPRRRRNAPFGVLSGLCILTTAIYYTIIRRPAITKKFTITQVLVK